jgi:hypothetical protein
MTRMLPALFIEGTSLGTMCRTCGRFVGRRRGNLRTHASWESAVYALVEKHEQKHDEPAPPAGRGRP